MSQTREATNPKLTLDDIVKFNVVARALGRAPGYLTAMQRAGYVPPIPGRTTKRHVLAWLGEHPDFRPSLWLTPQKTRELRAARARQAALAADRSH